MNKQILQILGALVIGIGVILAVIAINDVSQAANAWTPTANLVPATETRAAPTLTIVPPTAKEATPNANDMMLSENVAGTYLIEQSGTKSDPVVIDGNGFTAQCVKVTGSHVTVKNFIVEDCESHAILILGNDVTVENNTVRYSVTENGKVNCDNPDGGWGSGIKAERGSHDVTIRGNKVYENCGEGIASTMSYNVLIEGNTVWDNFSVNIYVDNSYNVTVQNNVVYCSGIYLRAGKRPTGISFAEESYKDWGTQRHDNSAISNQVNGCDAGIVSWISELPTGREVRLLIEGNRIFHTIGRSIELNTVNVDVIIRGNISDKPVFVREPGGSTVTGNIEISATPSPLATVSVTVTSTLTTVP
ncbi:MAG: right-handed parallel beta-helix repeat-containing protein [Chloroflexi bacterium]|nr:right-handed parallel beta-helix repeat-containing protein [Chloroflexota bacterium]